MVTKYFTDHYWTNWYYQNVQYFVARVYSDSKTLNSFLQFN